MINLTCPNCAADLDLPENRDVVFCSYCGKKILIGEHTKVSGQVTVDDAAAARRRAENFVALAERCGKRGDKEKFNLYVDKALEEDISVGDKVDALLTKYKKLKYKEDKEEKKEDKEAKEDKKEDEWTDCCGCIIAAIVIFCVAGSCCG